jgi:hypothetical protein
MPPKVSRPGLLLLFVLALRLPAVNASAAHLPDELRTIARGARAVDLDADGDLDLVLASHDGIHVWLRSLGGRLVEQPVSSPIVRSGARPSVDPATRIVRKGLAVCAAERFATVIDSTSAPHEATSGCSPSSASRRLLTRTLSFDATRGPPVPLPL